MPQQPGPVLTTRSEPAQGAPFRFAPPKTNDPSLVGSSSGWNPFPVQRTLPLGFFDTPVAKMYVAMMDDEMDALRRVCLQGWSTQAVFKAAFYRAEGRFRAWLVEQPGDAFWHFVRDFGIYDQRAALMVMRYENRRSLLAAARG